MYPPAVLLEAGAFQTDARAPIWRPHEFASQFDRPRCHRWPRMASQLLEESANCSAGRTSTLPSAALRPVRIRREDLCRAWQV
jgi:hypothetical protein